MLFHPVVQSPLGSIVGSILGSIFGSDLDFESDFDSDAYVAIVPPATLISLRFGL